MSESRKRETRGQPLRRSLGRPRVLLQGGTTTNSNDQVVRRRADTIAGLAASSAASSGSSSSLAAGVPPSYYYVDPGLLREARYLQEFRAPGALPSAGGSWQQGASPPNDPPSPFRSSLSASFRELILAQGDLRPGGPAAEKGGSRKPPAPEPIASRCSLRDAEFLTGSAKQCAGFSSLGRCKRALRERTALASVPGSGSTWWRVVAELATKLKTGSVYHDAKLIQAGLLGEGHKGTDVVVVKTHWPSFAAGEGAADSAERVSQNYQKGFFQRAVFLVRHPLRAVLSWASFDMGGHARELESQRLEEHLDDNLERMLRGWRLHAEYWTRNASIPVAVLRYEDQLRDQESAWTKTVLPFLGHREDGPWASRLRCAFAASALPTTRRNHTYVFPFSERHFQKAEEILGKVPEEQFGYRIREPYPKHLSGGLLLL